MSSPNEPLRLLHTHDPAFAELEHGLRQARACGPSDEQRLRIGLALGLSAQPIAGGAQVEEGARGARAARAAREPSRVPTWVKLLLGGLIGLVAIGALRVLYSPESSEERAAPLPSPGGKPAASAPVVIPNEQARPPTPSAPEHASPLPMPRPRPRDAAAVHREPRSEPAPQASATFTEELELLRRAKASAVSEPERALALLDEHERRFARGALAQEREVIAVEALLSRGDRARAEQRAAKFLAHHPGSAHARRIHALLGERTPSADSDAKSRAAPHPSL
jgi:hypothetical protein